jgi:hypothetical protein
MEKIKEKIKKEYFKYLTDKEYYEVDTLNADELLSLVNVIWSRYLRKNYLVHKVSPLAFLDDINGLLNANNLGFIVINKADLTDGNIAPNICGIICANVKLNKIILPDEIHNLMKKDISYFPEIILNTNLGEGPLSSSYENASSFAEEYNIDFLSVSSKIGTREDYSDMARDIIISSLFTYGLGTDINLRDKLVKKYEKLIIKMVETANSLEDQEELKNKIAALLSSELGITK